MLRHVNLSSIRYDSQLCWLRAENLDLYLAKYGRLKSVRILKDGGQRFGYFVLLFRAAVT